MSFTQKYFKRKRPPRATEQQNLITKKKGKNKDPGQGGLLRTGGLEEKVTGKAKTTEKRGPKKTLNRHSVPKEVQGQLQKKPATRRDEFGLKKGEFCLNGRRRDPWEKV